MSKRANTVGQTVDHTCISSCRILSVHSCNSCSFFTVPTNKLVSKQTHYQLSYCAQSDSCTYLHFKLLYLICTLLQLLLFLYGPDQQTCIKTDTLPIELLRPVRRLTIPAFQAVVSVLLFLQGPGQQICIITDTLPKAYEGESLHRQYVEETHVTNFPGFPRRYLFYY